MCLFDKTGTITSDKLQAESLVAPQPLHPDEPPVTVTLGGKGGSIGAVSEGTVDITGAARTGLAAEVSDNQSSLVAVFLYGQTVRV